MPDATLILHNARILTLNGEQPVGEAVAVGADGRILAVGSDSAISNLAQPGTRRVNLNGQTLIPGFFDCHLHLLWLGENLGHVNLASPPVRDKSDIIGLLRQRLDAQPDLDCVQGNRYDQNKLTDGQHLTRHDLDQVTTHLPVLIVHTSGHGAVVNSRALAMLGIGPDTPDPVGGEIARDAGGQPTGLLLETASWNGMERIVPPLTQEDSVAALAHASAYLLERGITSASDANTLPADLAHYTRAVGSDTLQVRVNCMIGWAEIMRGLNTNATNGGGSAVPTPDALQPVGDGVNWHRLHVGQAKLFSDGAITTRTCWLKEPFAGTTDAYGIPIHAPDELRAYILAAHLAGWQIATHAIGDRAVDVVLAAYADAQARKPRFRPDHRIEHCMLLDEDLIARLRRQKVWSIGQPEFLSNLGDAYVTALGEERANRLSPYATLEARDIAQAFSSDCPVVPGAPLDGMRAAMLRATHSGRVLNGGERVSGESALYYYTAAPAYATRTERDRGSIEVGKWADFTVLSADPTTTPADEWERVQVVATFVGGRCLYGERALR